MSDSQAQSLFKKAEEKEQYKSWFGGNKLDEAYDLYQQAANGFKLSKNMQQAGNAFYRAAQVALKLNEKNDASTQFVNASKAFKKVSPQDAINNLKLAIDILTEGGRFHAAANHQKEIANLYETELSDFSQAMSAYELAADWYSGEDSNAIANSCRLKAAEFAAQLEQYEKAAATFEEVAASSIDNQLTKWSVKEYLLKAGLCRMCMGDIIGTQRSLRHYEDMDLSFSQTRECKFLNNLVESLEAEDVEAFTNHVYEFDQLTKFDNWKTTLLLRIKKSIGDEPSLT